MVSLRCKLMVQQELEKLGILYKTIDLGLVKTHSPMTQSTKDQLHKALLKSGLEILNDKRSIFVEKIKTAIVELIHTTGYIPNVNYSDYLSELLGYDYTHLANTFSEVKGTTIQQYIIINKIGKAKELLLYNELSLTEISYKLNYSSVAHLSNQFKKITGLTPTYYKKLKEKRKKNLEDF